MLFASEECVRKFVLCLGGQVGEWVRAFRVRSGACVSLRCVLRLDRQVGGWVGGWVMFASDRLCA